MRPSAMMPILLTEIQPIATAVTVKIYVYVPLPQDHQPHLPHICHSNPSGSWPQLEDKAKLPLAGFGFRGAGRHPGAGSLRVDHPSLPHTASGHLTHTHIKGYQRLGHQPYSAMWLKPDSATCLPSPAGVEAGSDPSPSLALTQKTTQKTVVTQRRVERRPMTTWGSSKWRTCLFPHPLVEWWAGVNPHVRHLLRLSNHSWQSLANVQLRLSTPTVAETGNRQWTRCPVCRTDGCWRRTRLNGAGISSWLGVSGHPVLLHT
ncbi:hypothetical protein B0T21DRAFT_189034 [Apiosordaria backusii]|uniref:Uncharacterized protein n=1 Tax=Apiosordaria backusii TaxID=314023 RepID=A0AA40BJY0_9PEZI|nr:hypothetical protein B0T21DRAFT_189034 [Apiosordaria backusii]